ncbi:MAG TPA: dienelactone hydrolase family protein [Phenylobacterium sp.]
MCDDDINPWLPEDISRRAFGVGATLAVTLTAAEAGAQAGVTEKDVVVKTADGEADAVLLYPAGKGPWPGVLIWTDIGGLRPVFREMGKRLAAQGYTVLVPNPFYRSAKPEAYAKLSFGTPEGRQALMGYRGAMKDEGVDADSKAYIAFLDAQPQTNKKKKVGVQGYCMGGPLTFRTTAAVADRVGASATFHGGGLVTPQPNSPHLLVAKTKSSYLCCVAKNDDARAPTDKDVLKKALDDAKRPNTVEVYGGDHGWTVPGSAVYNQAEAERAWAALTALYKKNLA